MASNKKSLGQTIVDGLTEQALFLTQIKLLMKFHPEFTRELKALIKKYSKKPNPINQITNLFK